MNQPVTCDEVQLLAPEVALGIASGDERALVLAHTRSCADCRRMMEELAVTADALLLSGPLHEPASGFESTVLARMDYEQRPSSRMRSKLVAVAAAAALAVGAVAFWITSDDRRLATHYRDALAEANGKYFGVVGLWAPGGERVGHMFAYAGDVPWVFLIFTTPLEPALYEAELETPGGRVYSLGTFEITSGHVTWGRDLPVELRDVRTVRILDDTGIVAVRATFPSR